MLPKIALLIGLAMVAGGAWWMLRDRGGSPDRAVPAASTPTATPGPNPTPEPSPSVSPSPSPELEHALDHEDDHRPYHIERKPEAKPGEPAAAPVASEIEIVELARRQLAAERWSLAYAAAVDHAKHYPDGILAEEREAIAVEALVRLDRADDARDRLSSFLRRYPRSSYRRHLERLAAEPP